MNPPTCELCATPGGVLLASSLHCRVVRVEDPNFPGFCRVIANRHVKEMTDLTEEERAQILHWVFLTERSLIELLAPDKVNLASLGNVTPHVHWHVIPRWSTDSRYPDPIWAASRRIGSVPVLPTAFDRSMAQRFAAMN